MARTVVLSCHSDVNSDGEHMTEHLTHGWEPDAPADDCLLRRFVLSSAEVSAWIAERVGGRAQRWDDVAAADAGSPLLFDNLAVLLAPPQYIDCADAVARVIDAYPPQRHFVLLSAWPTPDLNGQGLQLMGHPPFMTRAAGGAPTPAPEGLRVVEVTDAAALADATEVLAEGFGIPTSGSAVGKPEVLGGPLRIWVGYEGPRAVATAAARVSHGVIDVEAVATVPDCRGRGYGEALTWAATLADPALPAVLYASDSGRPVYERMGYLTQFRFTLWHRPPAG
jgi:hypothetical protein